MKSLACKHDKNQVGKLKPLPEDNEGSYLVSLRFRRPKTIFGWPLFAFRTVGAQPPLPGIDLGLFSRSLRQCFWHMPMPGIARVL